MVKCKFTTDIRFLHGFEKLILGWMFIDLGYIGGATGFVGD